MFDFFKSCIVVACDNYFKTIINMSLKQQICYNVHTCDLVTSSHPNTHYGIHLQLVFDYDSH